MTKGNVIRVLEMSSTPNLQEKENLLIYRRGKREQFFQKFYFPLYRGLYPIYDILTYREGGYEQIGGVGPHAKGEGEGRMLITLMSTPPP